jgi:hypothetical protein
MSDYSVLRRRGSGILREELVEQLEALGQFVVIFDGRRSQRQCTRPCGARRR